MLAFKVAGVLVVGLGLWAFATGCNRDKAPAVTTPEVRVPAPPQEAKPTQTPERFCILALEVEDITPPGLRIAGLWSVAARQALVEELATVDAVVAIAEGKDRPSAPLCAVDGPASGQVGLLLRFDYGLIDAAGKTQAPAGTLRAGQLHFAVTAHAERLGANGRPEIAEATPHGSVPFPANRANELAAYASVRLARAARMATADALGQLWVRHLPEAQVIAALEASDTWRRAAAIREAGERGMAQTRETIEGAAGDSRRDLAVVAAAALGRLGDARSLPVLEACLSHRDPEVIDAALSALADIPGPEARRLLQAATEHAHPWIRQRAGSLLER